MTLFMCFGGSAAVVDDDVAASDDMDAARHQRERTRSLSFRGKLLPGRRKDKTKKPSQPAEAKKKKHGVDADESAAASLEYSGSPSSASSRFSTASSVSSSASVSGLPFPPPAAKRQATTFPAAGAAAVVLCLLMLVFCGGRVGATVLTSTALYLFPRRWPARSMHQEDAVGYSLECGAAAEEGTPQMKVVTEGVLVTNRNN